LKHTLHVDLDDDDHWGNIVAYSPLDPGLRANCLSRRATPTMATLLSVSLAMNRLSEVVMSSTHEDGRREIAALY
jgi:hypothetical protein